MAKKKKTKKIAAVRRRTKKVSRQPEKKEVFFVGITDPIELRRSLLEASKDIIQDLQHFEQYVGARRQRKKLIEELKHDMAEIASLVTRLKKELPRTGLRAEKVPLTYVEEHEAPKKKHKRHHKKKVVKAPKFPGMKKQEAHELEKLETELTDIESKLGGIS